MDYTANWSLGAGTWIIWADMHMAGNPTIEASITNASDTNLSGNSVLFGISGRDTTGTTPLYATTLTATTTFKLGIYSAAGTNIYNNLTYLYAVRIR
jgi:hypothetical protein